MNRYETENKWEQAVGLSLAVVGIAVVWSVALGTLAEQPIQSSGTQRVYVIKGWAQ